MPRPNALVAIIALQLAGHEASCAACRSAGLQLAVVERHRIALPELLVQPLRLLDRGAVDDAACRRSSRSMRSTSASFSPAFTVRTHLEAEVGAREAGDVHRAGRVMPSWRAMSSRTSAVAVAVSASTGGRAEPLDDGAQREVVGPEVVPPLAHAVRLVHDEQAHRAREQVLEEVAVLEALGREVEDLALALRHLPRRLARLGRGEVRVHGQRVHAVRVRACRCWSFISAMSGLTTTVRPGRSSAGSW